MSKIVLTGGGTAGHCKPNINLIPYIKNDFDSIYYIGSENGIENTLLQNTNVVYYKIPTTKLKRHFTFENLKIPFILYKGINTAKNILRTIQPDVIFSKGGYVALPVTIAAKQLKIPIVLHESDYSIGLANKISSKFASLTLTSFEDTAKKLNNALFVGAPVQKNLQLNKLTAFKKLNIETSLPVLLVLGGSLGSKKLNDVLRKSLSYLTKKFFVLHVTGKGNLDSSVVYKNYLQLEYLENINYAYTIANIALTRAGANTLFELIEYKIPAIAVPLPKNASRGDQIENAIYFYKRGLIDFILQENLSFASLCQKIDKLYDNRFVYLKNLNSYQKTNALQEIANILRSYKKQFF